MIPAQIQPKRTHLSISTHPPAASERPGRMLEIIIQEASRYIHVSGWHTCLLVLLVHVLGLAVSSMSSYPHYVSTFLSSCCHPCAHPCWHPNLLVALITFLLSHPCHHLIHIILPFIFICLFTSSLPHTTHLLHQLVLWSSYLYHVHFVC